MTSKEMLKATLSTRKPHQCEWCPEPIKVGGPAMSRAYIWEGEFHHGYLHSECWDALRASNASEDGFALQEQPRGTAMDGYGDPLPAHA